MSSPSPRHRPPLVERLRLRAKVDGAIRRFFDERGLLEVHVPSIVPVPGMEDHLDAFPLASLSRTSWGPFWLHTSPEFAIKERFGELGVDVYCMDRVYRDEPSGPHHSPEFTMLEWYRRDADYFVLMEDVEALICAVVEATVGDPTPTLVEGHGRVDLRQSWPRMTWQEAFAPFLDEDPLEADHDAWRRALERAGIFVDEDWDTETLQSMLWAELVEPAFGERPIFLIEFPASQASLARLRPDDGRVAERFEAYLPGRWERTPGWGGIEIANAFSELIDPIDQRRRFARCLEGRARSGAPLFPMPEDLLRGLESMPKTAGIALGVDRLTTWIAQSLLGWAVEVSDFYCTARRGL